MQIRPVSEADYEALAPIASKAQAELINAAQLLASDREVNRTPGSVRERFVAEVDGKLVGYGSVEATIRQPKGRWHLFAAVAEGHRGRGVGGRLLQAAEQLAARRGAEVLQTIVFDPDDTVSLAWVERRGYKRHRQRTQGVLKLASWSAEPFAEVVAGLKAQGFRIEVYDNEVPAELMPEVYEQQIQTFRDVPSVEVREAPPYEIWKTNIYEAWKPWVAALVFDGERLVSSAWVGLPKAEGQGGYNHYTATLKAYRGKGIGLAAEVAAMEAAAQKGVTELYTNNDPDNPAMLAVNEKLGYEILPGPWILLK